MGLNVDAGDQTVSEQSSSSSDNELTYNGCSVSTTKADIVGSSRSDGKNGGPKLISTSGGNPRGKKFSCSSDSSEDSSDMDIGSIDALTGVKHSAKYNNQMAEQRKKGQYDPLLHKPTVNSTKNGFVGSAEFLKLK